MARDDPTLSDPAIEDLGGKLEVFEPILLFQMLNLAHATGALQLRQPSNTATIYFQRGNIIYAGIESRPRRLGELLVQDQAVSEGDLDQALKNQGKGEKLGSVLLEKGLIEEQELRQAIEEQIHEVIYEVVRWRDGSFAFESGIIPDGQDVLIDAPPHQLMLEGLRRLDEERQDNAKECEGSTGEEGDPAGAGRKATEGRTPQPS